MAFRSKASHHTGQGTNARQTGLALLGELAIQEVGYFQHIETMKGPGMDLELVGDAGDSFCPPPTFFDWKL